MKGYKVFNSDWTCRDFQYETGKTYEVDGTPKICKKGFHFCEKAFDCFSYYTFDPSNKAAEIIAHGEIDKTENGDKFCTNKIEIVREIPWTELLELVNTGKGNTGYNNSGNRNSGHVNSGNRNSGDTNSGNRNSGDNNSGNRNSGNRNSGNYNSGYSNSGHRNSGHRNSGDTNSGYSNSGNRNSGNCNSGNYNSGYSNSGDYNASSFSAGCFNTEKHDLLFFDKPTKMTFEEWRSSSACKIMNRVDLQPTVWINEINMTDAEKADHPKFAVTGGYLKIRDNSDSFHKWWNGLTDTEKEIVKGIPNFNPEKFKTITGIEV